jgi:hypothetical protein
MAIVGEIFVNCHRVASISKKLTATSGEIFVNNIILEQHYGDSCQFSLELSHDEINIR